MENILIVNFDVESEAYQALSELRREAITPNYTVSQACIVKKEFGRINALDQFDTGIETANDTGQDSLIGALVGIIGGPIGVLLGGSMGALIGSVVDAGDAVNNASMIEKVCDAITDDETALIALVSEDRAGSIEAKFNKFSAHVVRLDAAEVAAEVEKAREMQRQMEKDARAKLREEKQEAFGQKVEEQRKKIAESFDSLKEKLTARK